MVAVRTINGTDSTTKAGKVHKFMDRDGNVCTTPAENAAAAAEHYTKFFNTTHDEYEAKAAALNEVRQREVRVELGLAHRTGGAEGGAAERETREKNSMAERRRR